MQLSRAVVLLMDTSAHKPPRLDVLACAQGRGVMEHVGAVRGRVEICCAKAGSNSTSATSESIKPARAFIAARNKRADTGASMPPAAVVRFQFNATVVAGGPLAADASGGADTPLVLTVVSSVHDEADDDDSSSAPCGGGTPYTTAQA